MSKQSRTPGASFLPGGLSGQSSPANDGGQRRQLSVILGERKHPTRQGDRNPEESGGVRILGVPTVADRVAQMVVKQVLEPLVVPVFHPDSYGYRPGRSAAQALDVTRKRCWQYDWVLEFDIKGLFDNIDHDRLMRAVRWHTDNPWVRLYIARWRTAPFQRQDNTLVVREKGTPQGGVVSPVLANLFLHYAFDRWMARTHPSEPFARYADDAVVHCRSAAEAERLKAALQDRFAEVGLELHPTKTRIVYCRDSNRTGSYPHTRFDFLGYTFQPRLAQSKDGRSFVSFAPAVSRKAQTALRQKLQAMHLVRRTDLALEDLARLINPIVRGGPPYFGQYHRSVMRKVLAHLNWLLVQWVRRKYKPMRQHQRRATHWLGRLARRQPGLFVHWQLGVLPAAE